MVDGKLCSEEFDRSDTDCESKSVSNNASSSKTCTTNVKDFTGDCDAFWCNTKCVAIYSVIKGSHGVCTETGQVGPLPNYVCRCTYNC